jgi:hypothetical protein
VAAVIEAIEPASTLRTENLFVLFTCCPTCVSRRCLMHRSGELCQNKMNENLNAFNNKCSVI